MCQINFNPKDHSELSEKIHSGQFMISKYDEESDSEDIRNSNFKERGYNFDSSLLKKNFRFTERGQCEHKIEIDDSLSTMLKYLSIAMSGKISNPKWNSFKGVQFQPKDKIRLNNIIWREYHMQFVKKLKPVVVQFASPLSDILQINGNVVLEGKYWKRTFNIIVHQYKKWREFYKRRLSDHFEDPKKAALFNSILVQRSLYHKLNSDSPPPNLNDIFMDLDDLNLPIDDITGVQHNSQIIQPQLTNLQPRMESSIDFLNDYFCAPQKTMESQKRFSSETCLNIKSRQINTVKNSHLQSQKMTHSRPNEGSSTMKPFDIDYDLTSSKVNKRKLNMNPPPHCQNRSNHSDNKGNGPDTGFCKTPNLLSILLQPMSSDTAQLRLHRPLPHSNTLASLPSKPSLIATSNDYSNRHGPVERIKSSSVDLDRYSHNPISDVSTYNPQEMKHLKFDKSTPHSVFNQSIRTNHSLSTSNIVQQNLEELSGLLMSTRGQNKISKAALLHKASEHIKRLRIEKHRLQSEVVALQHEIDSLQNKFSAFCSQLPANGVCLSNTKSSEGKKWFEDFVMKHSATNWKFYIFSMMFESLFNGYNNSVNTSSMETLAHNVASWLEKECSLMKLRLIVINGMRTLSRRTSIVHSPRRLEDEVKSLVEASLQSQEEPGPPRWPPYQPEERPSDGYSDQYK